MTPATPGADTGAAAGSNRTIQRLALATIAMTFLLILVGGIVRVSGSGLGCGPANSGFHGWPFCNGAVVPGLDVNTIIEYTHRTVAGIVGLMSIALTALAWRNHRGNRPLVRATTAATVLVIVQGLLGAATVENDLDELLVAAHLGLAMIFLALLIFIWRVTKPENLGAEPPSGGRGYRPLALVTSAFAFCTIVAGGYMAGTQNYGRADYELGDGAHHACGREFPSCNGDFLPFGQTRLVDIHLTHRVFVYLTTLLVLWLVVLTLRRRPSPSVVRYAWVALGILGLQLLLGALNVWLEEYEALIVAHLAVGTLLWATLAGLALQLFRVPQALESPPGERSPEALSA